MKSLPQAKSIRVAITGANGNYARTLLAQLRNNADVHPTLLVDLNKNKVFALIQELGLKNISVASDIQEIDWELIDVIVEATGDVNAGISYASAAIDHGVNVVMVSKEVESVAGTALWQKANAVGVRYLLGDGDQPANAIRLVTWIEKLGLDIVAIGKSSEYDLVFDPTTGQVTQFDTVIEAPGLKNLLELGEDVRSTLDSRAREISPLPMHEAADYCEMSIVAQYMSATSCGETLHYPVARPSELADIYALREHGGITNTSRSIDVFSALRLPGEASYAGGVFVVVRTNDRDTWRLLGDKGHVVSRDGRYACIGWPYHLMGVETLLTIYAAHTGDFTSLEPRQHLILGARTDRKLIAGTEFKVFGHHHAIDGVRPVFRSGWVDDTIPFYLLAGARLKRDVPNDHLIGFEDVVGINLKAASLFHQGKSQGAG